MKTILLQNLSIGYPKGKSVASNLNAEFESGKLSCLLGSNGIGKSTLLKTICGFLPPKNGNILIDNTDIVSLSSHDMAKITSVVLTVHPDADNFSAEEMVAMGRSPYTGFWGKLGNKDKMIVSQALTMVNINHLKGRKMQNLSDGERQKVMIAKALAQQTSVILLDEPTAFLDYPSKVEMMQLLHRLSSEMEKTILLSTHDLELAVAIADTLWQFDNNGLKKVSKDKVQQEINGLLLR